jgi:cyanoexosortase A
LLALAAALSAIYFTLVWKADDTGQLSMSFLFYFCVISLLKDQASRLTLKRDWLSWGIGGVLIGWVLWQSTTTPDDYTVRLFPFVSGVGVGLLASGWRNLKQYWRPLLILFFLGVPSVLAYHFIDIAPLTARFSTLLLWYAGFDVMAEGTYIALADGRVVQVVYDCSGIDMVNYLLGMSIICLVMFPISGRMKQILVPMAGAFIGFLVNGIRVALMVVLAKFDQSAFNNWHTGTGSYTFAVLGIAMLGFLYWLLLNQGEGKPHPLEKWESLES